MAAPESNDNTVSTAAAAARSDPPGIKLFPSSALCKGACNGPRRLGTDDFLHEIGMPELRLAGPTV